MSTYLQATVLLCLLFAASVISVELGIAAAVIEIIFGVIAGNLFHIHTTAWIDFLAVFGGAYLVFLAGTEVDVPLMKKNWKETLLIGGAAFCAPLLAGFVYAYYGAHWTLKASELAGVAISGTSLAIVYAVLVEMGLSATELGKRIMSATFITDTLTVIALTLLFLHVSAYTVWFTVVSILLIACLPRFFARFLRRYGDRVIQPEIKLLFVALFLIEWLGTAGNNQPVLPLFILGVAMSATFAKNHELVKKMRLVAFTLITPFFFLKGGINVELPYVAAGLGAVFIFFGLKFAAKFIAVSPLAAKYHAEHGKFTTMLMSTDLTFGTIAALYGLDHNVITRQQFSILIAAVILSAVVPTVLAFKFFKPAK